MCGLSSGAQNRVVLHWRQTDTVHSYRHRPSVLREPLLHFVLIGAALFALHGWVSDRKVVFCKDPGVRVAEHAR